MSDKTFERLEQMMGDLIKMVGATNTKTINLEEQIAKAEAQAALRHAEIMAKLEDMEKSMYRLERMELRQNRTVGRVDELEADVALIRQKLQN